jgi:hypothetical protein
MSNNPYQPPLSEQESPPRDASRFEAAGNAALRGGVWAAKWTAIVFGPVLTLPWIALTLIGLYGYGKVRVAADGLLPYTLNLIGGLVLSLFALGMVLVFMASVGAVLAGIQEAMRFRKASRGPQVQMTGE